MKYAPLRLFHVFTLMALALGFGHGWAGTKPEAISLGDRWRFELDRGGVGVQEKWFARDLPGTVRLPGSLPAQGIGDDPSLETKWVGGITDEKWAENPAYAPYTRPGSFRFPFWLEPGSYYMGAAWYQRDIEIPEKWQSQRVTLHLERPHWETRVWVDDKFVGQNNSLSVPHEYDLGMGLTPGKHRLTIRVDNSMVVDVGINSHSVTDHTQGNWNGIVGNIFLQPRPPVWIADLQVYPHLGQKSITVRGQLGNVTGKAGSGTLMLRVDDALERAGLGQAPGKKLPVAWHEKGGAFEFDLPVAAPRAWDEFSPNLLNLVAWLEDSDDWKTVQFGFREVTAEGTHLLVNGRRTFIRGTLECCIFPLTGHPPVKVDEWARIIKIAKAHGLNLFRFHSYCPPEAAFAAADSLGFYLQVETCWPNQSTTLGDGKPVDKWVYEETDRILQAYGNHPSFLLMAHGNEPGGNGANAYLAKYVSHYKAREPRRLWTSGSGWPQLPENQFHVTPDPRIQAWGGGLKSRINALPPETRTDYRQYISQRNVPVISHEIGQWCVYPNFDEIKKYKGYLKPRNFEVFRDNLKANHMGDLAEDFLLASGKLQTICYKEDIESALRTPGMAGFQLLDLHDFPGQGTALVGVLDPFWEPKGYVTAAGFSRFCNTTVPLARLDKRVFTTQETLKADIDVAHFGPKSLQNAVVAWKLVGNNRGILASGKFPVQDIQTGSIVPLGSLNVDLSAASAPAAYKLVVGLENTRFENDWDLWVYPPDAKTQTPANVMITQELDDAAVATLKSGGKVLLMIPPSRVKGDKLGKVEMGFSPIFWNTAWTGRQPPHTLGLLCDPNHPAFAAFPTEYHSNWQWWYLVSRAGAMILDDLPPDLRPTVQVIDDWVTNRKLGLLFEGKVGRGRLMVCSIDLKNGLAENPVARQFLSSLLNYMSSPRFKPKAALQPEQVRKLM